MAPDEEPSDWQGRPGAGAPSRYCNLQILSFQPQISRLGVARFRVRTTVEGPYSRVTREVEVRKGFSVVQVTPDGTLALFRLTPGNIAQFVEREVAAHEGR